MGAAYPVSELYAMCNVYKILVVVIMILFGILTVYEQIVKQIISRLICVLSVQIG